MSESAIGPLERARFIYRAWRYRVRTEAAEIAFLRQHLSQGQTCVDVGGHKGALSFWMQRCVGTTGRLFTFEPQPELAAYLRSVVATFGWQHVEIIQAAASCEPGLSELYRPADSPSPGASLQRHAAEEGSATQVRTESLDHFFASRPERPIGFIKCDAEGHELDVFRGATHILSDDQPVLLFECEQRHLGDVPIVAVFDFLEQFGYHGSFFHRGRRRPLSEFEPVVYRRGDPDYIYNFAFCPHEADAQIVNGRRQAG